MGKLEFFLSGVAGLIITAAAQNYIPKTNIPSYSNVAVASTPKADNSRANYSSLPELLAFIAPLYLIFRKRK